MHAMSLVLSELSIDMVGFHPFPIEEFCSMDLSLHKVVRVIILYSEAERIVKSRRGIYGKSPRKTPCVLPGPRIMLDRGGVLV